MSGQHLPLKTYCQFRCIHINDPFWQLVRIFLQVATWFRFNRNFCVPHCTTSFGGKGKLKLKKFQLHLGVVSAARKSGLDCRHKTSFRPCLNLVNCNFRLFFFCGGGCGCCVCVFGVSGFPLFRTSDNKVFSFRLRVRDEFLPLARAK